MKESVGFLEVSIPEEILQKWHRIVNTGAELLNVPAALLTRLHAKELEILTTNDSDDNPIPPGSVLRREQLYCMTVIQTRGVSIIPNALADSAWRDSKGAQLGLIAYMGMPVLWPDGSIFGTICVLDTKENHFSGVCERFWAYCRELIESHLALLYANYRLEMQNAELHSHITEINALRGILPICACCKRIRDDAGYWKAVEEYISQHSDATFTHGYCPECLKIALRNAHPVSR